VTLHITCKPSVQFCKFPHTVVCTKVQNHRLFCNCRFPVLIELHNISSIKIAIMGRGSSSSTTKFKDLKLQWLKHHIDMKVIVIHYLEGYV